MLRSFDIKRVRPHSTDRILDSIAVEEPLAIHISHSRKNAKITEHLAVTMRTPGADKELAIGLLITEGVIRQSTGILDARPLGTEPCNEILIELAPHIDFDSWRQQRTGFVSSSCGVCGKASADQIQQTIPAIEPSAWRVSPSFIHALPKRARDRQTTFNQTGGVHAAALFTLDGQLVTLFEDIGRHNALDKVIGHATLANLLPLNNHVVFMSSRASFELIQKAAMAGAQLLASVGGPSSLAVETARRLGLTLLCFVRDERFNIYSGDWRVNL